MKEGLCLKLGGFSVDYLRGGKSNIDGGGMFGVVGKRLWSKK